MGVQSNSWQTALMQFSGTYSRTIPSLVADIVALGLEPTLIRVDAFNELLVMYRSQCTAIHERKDQPGSPQYLNGQKALQDLAGRMEPLFADYKAAMASAIQATAKVAEILEEHAGQLARSNPGGARPLSDAARTIHTKLTNLNAVVVGPGLAKTLDDMRMNPPPART